MPYQDIALPTELNSMVSMFHIVIFNNYENYHKGRSGIRTHAPFYRPDGFQDRSLKPDLGILP